MKLKAIIKFFIPYGIVQIVNRKKSKIKTDTENQIWFNNCLQEFKNKDTKKRFTVSEQDFWKCFGDNTENTGFDTQYEYHQAWATRCLQKIAPQKHIDISSKITFNAVLSAFIPVDFYDFRPPQLYNLSNLTCKSTNLINLHFESNSIHSLSCMHVVEHIGLGRYGDTIDPEGDLKAIHELKRVIAPEGNLLFVVPIGKPRIQFNAHRIYSYKMITEYFSDFELIEYALIPDNAQKVGILYNAKPKLTDEQNYACGCFWFKKKNTIRNKE